MRVILHFFWEISSNCRLKEWTECIWFSDLISIEPVSRVDSTFSYFGFRGIRLSKIYKDKIWLQKKTLDYHFSYIDWWFRTVRCNNRHDFSSSDHLKSFKISFDCLITRVFHSYIYKLTIKVCYCLARPSMMNIFSTIWFYIFYY